MSGSLAQTFINSGNFVGAAVRSFVTGNLPLFVHLGKEKLRAQCIALPLEVWAAVTVGAFLPAGQRLKVTLHCWQR